MKMRVIGLRGGMRPPRFETVNVTPECLNLYLRW